MHLIGRQNAWEQDSRRPRHPPSPRRRRTLHRRGLPKKSTRATIRLLRKSARCKGLMENPSQGKTRQPKHRLCMLLHAMREQSSGTQRKVRQYKLNQYNTGHCRCRRCARPLRRRARRESTSGPESTPPRRKTWMEFSQKPLWS